VSEKCTRGEGGGARGGTRQREELMDLNEVDLSCGGEAENLSVKQTITDIDDLFINKLEYNTVQTLRNIIWGY